MRTILALSLILLSACGPKAADAPPPAPPPVPAPLTQAEMDSVAKVATEAADQAAMLKEAKIPDSSARATALKAVPKGTIKEGGLERENGKLIYSFDLVIAGKPGVEEVAVDAMSGKLLSKTHETPAAEKREAKQDSSKVKATAAGKGGH